MGENAEIFLNKIYVTMKKILIITAFMTLKVFSFAQTIKIEIKTDYYANETSWKIFNSNSQQILGLPTSNYSVANQVYTNSYNISPGTYSFTIYDLYADGLCCSTSGYYKIIHNNVVLAEGSGNFGSSQTKSFTIAATDPCANNTLPTITLSSSSSSIVQGNSITLNATASDANGSIAKVEFYNGSTKLGEDASSPYSFSLTPSTAGSFSYSARAIDNCNAVGVSNQVTVSVTSNNPCSSNTVPTVSLTQPSNGQVFTTGNTVSVAANASDANGTISYVRFYQNGTLIAEDATNPYTHSIVNIQAGTYTISALSFDNCGAQSVSGAVSITVNNQTSGSSTSCNPWGLNCTTAGDITRSGRVGIGNSTFTGDPSYLLYVKGGVKAEKVQMELAGTSWPDYVFEADYHLKKLSEIEIFVKTNKHLPEIPSEKELLQKGGLELGEMTVLQQKKIEELFLYVIELNKTVESLKSEIHKLKSLK